MKKIKLTKGKYTLVDDEDFISLSKFKWYAGNPNKNYFVARRMSPLNGKQEAILMHRQILKAPPELVVDHKNHNPLDNRRKNLRLCNKSQNATNVVSWNTNTSGFKGICFLKRKKRWRMRIITNSKTVADNLFTSLELAVKTYKKLAPKYLGEFLPRE